MKRFLFLLVVLLSVMIGKAQTEVIQQSEKNISFEQVIKAVKESKFVFEADRVKGKNKSFHDVSPKRNFVSIDGNDGIMQFYTVWQDEHQKLRTVMGKTSDLNMTVDKKGNLIVKAKIKGDVAITDIEIFITKGTNKGEMRIKSRYAFPSLTVIGKLVPTSASQRTVGIEWRG